MKTITWKHLSAVIMALLIAAQARAADSRMTVLTTVKWSQLKEAGKLKSGEVIPAEKGQPERLKLVNTEAGVHSLPLCEIESPPITTASYAIRGTIRYQNVVGTGFLEMWNHFPDKGQYFSRTLDTSGPMGMVTGTSPERDFILPFHTLGQAPAPTKLVLNLVLNGPGEVEISSLELIPIDAFSGIGGSEWWNDRTAGLIGGIGGSILGLLGAALGVLTGVGRGQKLVLALSVLLAGAGFVVLAGGIYAAVRSQPYAVFYPLLMLGGMMLMAGFITLTVAPARFRDHELRRMQALDVT